MTDTATDTDTLPPPVLTHNGRVLTLTVRHQSHTRKDGEIRFREVTTVYFVELVKDELGKVAAVRLTTEDGETYTVWPHACSCPAWKYRAHQYRVACKHNSACRKLKLFAQPQEAQR